MTTPPPRMSHDVTTWKNFVNTIKDLTNLEKDNKVRCLTLKRVKSFQLYIKLFKSKSAYLPLGIGPGLMLNNVEIQERRWA